MKTIGYLYIGIFFGVVMYKSEAASWFRRYKMFHFDSFHMYGIIGAALVLGVIGVQIIKRENMKTFFGDHIKIAPKERGYKKYLFGGIIFDPGSIDRRFVGSVSIRLASKGAAALKIGVGQKGI